MGRIKSAIRRNHAQMGMFPEMEKRVVLTAEQGKELLETIAELLVGVALHRKEDGGGKAKQDHE